MKRRWFICRFFYFYALMETIPENTCTKIGYIQKPHGVNGELVLRLDGQYSGTLEDVKTVFLKIDGLLTPFFIVDDSVRFSTGESAFVMFEWIEKERQARNLAGLSVFVRNEDLNFGDELFDVLMLKGFMLFDQLKNQIGRINTVNDYSGNVILEVDHSGKEILVPFNEDFLIELDTHRKYIVLDLPGGILNLEEE